MVGGVWGSRKARRYLFPVCQPDTSSTAQSLTALFGGYLSAEKESPMNKLLIYLVNIKSPVRLYHRTQWLIAA